MGDQLFWSVLSGLIAKPKVSDFPILLNLVSSLKFQPRPPNGSIIHFRDRLLAPLEYPSFIE
jgi:hypothetical protein